MRLARMAVATLTAISLISVPAAAHATTDAPGHNPSPTLTKVERSATPTTRIVGGDVANRGTTPWYLLLYPYNNGNYYQCGGTAIGQRWILTAAHCVQGQSSNEIAQSEAYVNPATSDPEYSDNISWESVTTHPGYNWATDENDFALIRTTKSMNTTTLGYNADPATPVLDTALTVFGFGTLWSEGPSSTKLRVGFVSDLAGPSGECGQYGNGYDPSRCSVLVSWGVALTRAKATPVVRSQP